jgi:trimeric autotransporter adhesin
MRSYGDHVRAAILKIGAVMVLFLFAVATVSAQEWNNSSWGDGFVPPGLWGDGGPPEVFDMVDDDGRLYVAGNFIYAGGVATNYIGMWDDDRWHPLGDGAAGPVATIYHDGVRLYAAGNFGVDTPGIAYWNGSSWWSVGGDEQEFNGPIEHILHVNGQLTVAGSFTMIGDREIWRVALLDDYGIWQEYPGCGFTWSGYNYGSVNVIEDYHGHLWAGGDFDFCSPNTVKYLGEWVGTWIPEWIGTWLPPSGNMGLGLDGPVTTLHGHDGNLYIGGNFGHADGDVSVGMARLDAGYNLQPIQSENGADNYVNDITSLPDHFIRVATDFSVRAYGRQQGDVSASWHEFNGDIKVANVLTYMNNELYAGGRLMHDGGFRDGVAHWDGDGWRRLGAGLASNHTNIPDYVKCLLPFDGGLVAGGYFDIQAVSDETDDCHKIGLFDGDHWLPLSTGFTDEVLDLALYDGSLYACGEFDYTATPVAEPMNHVACWNPTMETWIPLGDGLNGNGKVMLEWNDLLIVGGGFTTADGVTASRIASWDGSGFSTLGSGCNGEVRALTVFDGDLVAAGLFSEAGGVPASKVAVWNGVNWSPLAGGFDGGAVEVLTVYGGELYAGGAFTVADGQPVSYLARWTGSTWVEVGGGVADGMYVTGVFSLMNNPPHGIYVGGSFSQVGDEEVGSVALWEGDGWLPLGSGVSGGYIRNAVYDFCTIDGDLYLGGDFKFAGDNLSASIARWRGHLTPVFMEGFSVVLEPAGVRIRWETSVDDAIYGFRLHGIRDGARWPVELRRQRPGVYSAMDTSPGSGEVEYELRGREGDEPWLLLQRGSVVIPESTPGGAGLCVFPNPGNPSFSLNLELPMAGPAQVIIFDVTGRLQVQLLDEMMPAGTRQLIWDGRNADGHQLSSGLYLARLRTLTGSVTRRVVILR